MWLKPQRALWEYIFFKYNVYTINIAVHRETWINNRNNSLSIYIYRLDNVFCICADRVFSSLDYAIPEVAEVTVVQDRSTDKTQKLVIQ